MLNCLWVHTPIFPPFHLLSQTAGSTVCVCITYFAAWNILTLWLKQARPTPTSASLSLPAQMVFLSQTDPGLLMKSADIKWCRGSFVWSLLFPYWTHMCLLFYYCHLNPNLKSWMRSDNRRLKISFLLDQKKPELAWAECVTVWLSHSNYVWSEATADSSTVILRLLHLKTMSNGLTWT